MRILLANHHLIDRAGSELYTCELAEALAEVGHQVAVFTFDAGELARSRLGAHGIPVFTFADRESIERFDPEILHVHHAPCLYFLGGLKLRSAVVFSSLGVIPALEAAPSVWRGVARGLAVSEEVEAALRQSPFSHEVPIELFRNWFDDRRMTQPSSSGSLAGSKSPRRWVVVTNHLDPTLAADLDTIAARHAGFEWVHFGAPHRSAIVDAAALMAFDGVITIGRTVLLAAAVGKPCLIYDVHGSDGLLEADRVEVLAPRNFSGRTVAARPTTAELESLLFEAAPRLDCAATAEAIWKRFRLTQRRDEVLSLYRTALDSGVRLDEEARAAYGKMGEIYAGAMAAMQHWRTRTAQLEHGLASANARADSAEHALNESAQRHAELEQKLGEIHESASWRMIGRLRNVKDRVLPNGTRHRRLYDSGLRLFKRG